MLQMLKSKNPDKEYPSNTGQKWTDEEETLLLENLSKFNCNLNIDIEIIAQCHNRSIGAIDARRRVIAYKLYSNNNTIEEIMFKTKLEKDVIIETIKTRINNSKKTQQNNTKICKFVTELNEMKNDIKELKNTIKELVEMMKAIYEFEDA